MRTGMAPLSRMRIMCGCAVGAREMKSIHTFQMSFTSTQNVTQMHSHIGQLTHMFTQHCHTSMCGSRNDEPSMSEQDRGAGVFDNSFFLRGGE